MFKKVASYLLGKLSRVNPHLQHTIRRRRRQRRRRQRRRWWRRRQRQRRRQWRRRQRQRRRSYLTTEECWACLLCWKAVLSLNGRTEKWVSSIKIKSPLPLPHSGRTDLDLFLSRLHFSSLRDFMVEKGEKFLWYFKAILTRMYKGPFCAVIFHDCTLWQSSNKSKQL